ncbi:MAG: hypothetical protein KatS3mg076_1764 [Candidatus Binatia bacterium]|nr:MAG: hypothetical protein KatS3mg076_1764 [Candidatus Binatia bacterium]
MKALQIVETAYRATLEEQDDTVLWLTHSMKGAGADLAVLLRGNAVNYVVRGQDASGLRFGQEAQTRPPRIPDDVASLLAKGVPVFVVREDFEERGLDEKDAIEGVQFVARRELPELFERFDRVWHW